MPSSIWVDALGTVAGVFTTFSASPQLLTTYRTRDLASFDLRFLIMPFSGRCLWAVYGIVIVSVPVTAFNSIGCLLWLPIIWMKIRKNRGNARLSIRSRKETRS